MEMGGKVSINCPKTGYRCDLEFKLKVIENRNTMPDLKIESMYLRIEIQILAFTG